MRRIVVTVLCLLLLNASLSFRDWWPTPLVRPDTRLAPEFLWLWVLLLGLVRWRGAIGPRLLRWLSCAYLVLVILRYTDVTVRSLFGRNLNVYWDLPQIPRFVMVSAHEWPWWQSLAALLALALPLWGLYAILRAAMLRTARDAIPYALRTRWTWGVTAVAMVLVVANHAGVRATWPVISKPVIPTYWHQANLLLAAMSPERMARLLPRSAAVDAALTDPSALGALGGRDLRIVMMETVGAVIYDNPLAASRLAPARERFAADVVAAGMGVVSAFVRSPTFGGGSDLAHLSLLSGIDLSDPRRHDLLLTSRRPTLNTVFAAHGYQTVGFYPSVSWEWPERAYYGYDIYIEGRDLGYRGPLIGPWFIPDQYAFARFEQMDRRTPSDPPRFVFAGTINTHLPFAPLPPYQPDWARVLESPPFDDADTERALAEQVDWLNMLPAYLRAVEYNYRWLGGWLQQSRQRETVFVMVGDHQPTSTVTGEGASWDVPVHIVASAPALLQRFRALGFHDGLEPPRAPLGGLHDLTGLLLRGFAGDAGRTTGDQSAGASRNQRSTSSAQL